MLLSQSYLAIYKIFMFNPTRIKKDFPIFKNNPGLIYFDNAATSQKPKQVIKALTDFYENYNSNVHRGIYKLAEKATAEYEKVRTKVAKFIGNKNPLEIIFTKGSTESINLVAHSLIRSGFVKEGDNVIVLISEHHSNLVPWQMLCKETKAKLKVVSVNLKGKIELEELYGFINKKTKVLALTHVSNSLGTINPIKEVIEKAKKINPDLRVLVDGAQSVPHMPVNVKEMNCDFFVFSGHKMLGPTGVGVLYARAEILEKMAPFLTGGEMIGEVSSKHSTWNEIPHKFEAGTPNIAQVIGLGAAIDYLQDIGLKNIRDHEKKLLKYALSKFAKLDGVQIYGPQSLNKRSGLITFNVKGIHPHDLAALLDKDNIAIRAGHHCTMPLHVEELKVEASCRISFYLYNNVSEIDKFFKSLEKAIKIFRS